MRKKRHKDGKEIDLSHASQVSKPHTQADTNINNLPTVSIDPLYHAVLRVEEGWGRRKIGRNDKIES